MIQEILDCRSVLVGRTRDVGWCRTYINGLWKISTTSLAYGVLE